MGISKKDQIVQGALTVFAQNGYSDTTMDAIAEAAQVAKGTLYYHFTTKEELFLYVIEKGVKMLIDSVESAMNNELLAPEDRMISVLDEHLRFFSENRELCFLLLSFFTGDENRDQMMARYLTDYFLMMERAMAQLQQQGCIKGDLEVQTLASALFGMVGFTVLRKQFRKEPLDLTASRATLRCFLEGIFETNK